MVLIKNDKVKNYWPFFYKDEKCCKICSKDFYLVI